MAVRKHSRSVAAEALEIDLYERHRALLSHGFYLTRKVDAATGAATGAATEAAMISAWPGINPDFRRFRPLCIRPRPLKSAVKPCRQH